MKNLLLIAAAFGAFKLLSGNKKNGSGLDPTSPNAGTQAAPPAVTNTAFTLGGFNQGQLNVIGYYNQFRRRAMLKR